MLGTTNDRGLIRNDILKTCNPDFYDGSVIEKYHNHTSGYKSEISSMEVDYEDAKTETNIISYVYFPDSDYLYLVSSRGIKKIIR